MNDNVQMMRELYDAFARGDIGTVLAALHPQVEWNEAEHSSFWPGHPVVGPDAVARDLFARIPETFDGFEITIDRVHGCGDTVIVEARYSGTAKATGKDLSAQVAHVWDIDDARKIVRFQQYTDTWEYADVTGIAPVRTEQATA